MCGALNVRKRWPQGRKEKVPLVHSWPGRGLDLKTSLTKLTLMSKRLMTSWTWAFSLAGLFLSTSQGAYLCVFVKIVFGIVLLRYFCIASNFGRFITQKPAEVEEDVMRQTQADFNTEENSSRPQSRPLSSMDTQDTVILTGASQSQDVSSAINRILEDVADISEEEEEDEEEKEEQKINDVVGNEELIEKDSFQESATGPDFASDPESDDEKVKEGEDGGVKVSKKRKRRLISDSEGSEDEEKSQNNEEESEEENDDVDLGVIKKIDYDSDENPVVVAKPLKNRMLTKGGKLRKDFVEGEAELSGSEEVKTFEFFLSLF